MKKKFLALILAVSMMSIAFTGCGSVTSSDSSDKSTSSTSSSEGSDTGKVTTSANGEKTLTFSVPSDPNTLAPWGRQGGGRDNSTYILYETLARTTLEGKLQNILAKDIKEVSDGVYDVTLYDYIKDTAGNPLKASDVVFSFQKTIEDGTYASILSSLKKYEAKDDYTVEFTMENEKIGNFETMLNYVKIVTKAAFDASSDGMTLSPIGTSPYKLKEYVAGSSCSFVKADSYWQTDKTLIAQPSLSNVDQIVMKIITDPSTAAVALETGEINSCATIATSDYGNFMDESGKAKDGFTVSVEPKAQVVAMYYNCSTKSPCQDINLRKAISYAIDRASIAQATYGAIGHASHNFTNPFWLDYDPAWEDHEYFGYDEKIAKDYLSKSSYKGEKLQILVNPNSEIKAAATLIQAYCAAVGINVELLIYEAALTEEYAVEPTGEMYDIFLTTHPSEYYSWLGLMKFDVNQYSNGLNGCYINDPKLQELYDNAANKSTSSVDNVNQLLTYIEDNCYATAINYEDRYVICTDNIKELAVARNINIIPGACTIE